ncbi:MAG: hypothetical protein A2Y10_17535 [Planctomycetes bacterium GWF2_41_51]|nr:MAG: hypothetical protein A2Y10_17535 [Planctomycetes bacterium GWF2_41_51]HBG28029.1 hypothetical protein [Phycisphaerales bacterium]
MKKLVVIMIHVCLLVSLGQAAEVWDSFNYVPGNIGGQSGGGGWAGSQWYVPTDTGYHEGTAEIVASSLVFSNYATSGGALKMVQTDTSGTAVQIGVRRQMGTSFTTGSDLWISFLAKADPALTNDFASRIAELRHGGTLGNCNFRMSPKMFDVQGVRCGYNSSSTVNDNTYNVQDGGTYLYIARFDNLGSSTGDGAAMWVFDEVGYNSAMTDGVFRLSELDSYYYLKSTDVQANLSMTTAYYAMFNLYDNVNPDFGYYFDELRYGYSLDSILTIPEPATIMLVAFGSSILLRKRK